MYGSSPAKDLNRRPFPPPYGHHHHHHQQLKEETELHSRQSEQQQQQMSSGLLRYRSAPSSLFGEACEDFLSARPSSPETETLFARFLSADPRDKEAPPPPSGVGGGEHRRNPEFPPPPQPQQQQQMLYQQQQHLVASMGMDADQIKNGSNLIRQSSSPAGLFSHLNVENGYGAMTRGVVGFANGNGGGGGTRLRSQLSFSSRQSSSSAAAMMSQISEEIENESMEGGYPIASWPPEDSSPLLSDNYFPAAGGGGGLRRTRENHSEIQNGNGLITHQFSLPKTSSEMAAMEKFLQFQDSVPCKIRAKRGCATHPRSIAERVRRTRISERMRKLQELVPNMDKQTNTADMLDLAVDYIKELQKQAKTLSNFRVNCTCTSSKQKPHANSTS